MSWIKLETSLRTHPKVVTLASRLGVTRVTVLGALCHAWMLADEHADETGMVNCMDCGVLDALVELPGFAKALAGVGWLIIGDDYIEFPNYLEHNGSTAKARASAQQRQAKSRKRHANVTVKRDTSVTREDKNREDKNRESTHTRAEAQDDPEPEPIGEIPRQLETLKSHLGTVRRGWGVEFGADERESLIRQGYLAALLSLSDDDWQAMGEMLGSSQKAGDRREALKIGMPNRRTLITNTADWLSNLERYQARHKRATVAARAPTVPDYEPTDEEREQMRRMIAESLKA